MLDLNNKSILITGGTGSFGEKFVEIVLRKFPKIKKLVIFSRDELKQFEMANRFPTERYKSLKFVIGDVRDKPRLKRAFEDIDIVVHAAALKQVPTMEGNPMECIKTNVLGSENVIEAALDAGVKNVVALSTDKAVAPISLYGATKLCSDKLFIAANEAKGRRDVKFSIVRFGNVMGSRGSVLPYFLEQKRRGFLPITDTQMSRFCISWEEGTEMIFHALTHCWGGEIYVRKSPSFKIVDLAEAIGEGLEWKIVGLRPGEKIHEEMINESDSANTFEFGKYFVVLPATTSAWNVTEWIKHFEAKPVPIGYKYESYNNKEWLTVEELKKRIQLYENEKLNANINL
ncbi:MAG TPA: UDP-N-acetylglucosamine 4,6-dehydratase (inverting) [Cytophagaceae bacterium]|jgi:UDP-N-acetylglucosamine 4,6-dehydratase (inverting)